MIQNLNKRITEEDRQEIKQYQGQINDSNKVALTGRIGKVYYKSYVKNTEALIDFEPNMDINTVDNQATVNGMIWSELRNEHFNFYPKLEELSHEILILRGEYDPIPRVYSEKIKSRTKNTQLIDFPNSGHMPHIEENSLTLEKLKAFF